MRMSRTTDRYRCLPLEAFLAHGNKVLVHSSITGRTAIISRTILNIITKCSSFATIQEHTDRISQALRLPEEQATSISAALKRCIEGKLFISDYELIMKSRGRATGSNPENSLCAMGWITRDRVQQLENSVKSYVDNATFFGHPIKCLIVDDSPQETVQNANRSVLAALQTRYGIRISYANREDRRRFAELLIAHTGCPQESAEFGLLPSVLEDAETMGASRNALLLATTGDLLFSTDDDTVATAADQGPREDSRGLKFCADDPTEFRFFRNRQEALLYCSSDRADIVGLQKQYLGKPLPELVNTFGERDTEIGEVCPHLLDALYKGGGKIRATLNGVLGDSGMYSGKWLLASAGITRERMLRSEADYRCALESREVLRVAPVVSVCHGGLFSSCVIGLDNRQLLPPFPPILRNEDGVFGAVLYKCFSGDFAAHLPLALVHEAAEGRSYSPGVHLRVCDFILAECEAGEILAGKTSAQNLTKLGSALIDSGELDPADFKERMQLLLWREEERKIGRLSTALDSYHASPEFWAKDVRNKIDRYSERMTLPDYLLPDDLPHSLGQEEALLMVQRIMRQYGKLLCWWPALVSAARELRERGESLARPL